MNNQGGMVKDKLAFLNKYKFTIAFENSRHSGYTTEKLVEPIPGGRYPDFYWGNRAVDMEFNTRSFVNCHEYDSFESVIEEIETRSRRRAVHRQDERALDLGNAEGRM